MSYKHFKIFVLYSDVVNCFHTRHVCQVVGNLNQTIPFHSLPVVAESCPHILVDCVDPLPEGGYAINSRAGNRVDVLFFSVGLDYHVRCSLIMAPILPLRCSRHLCAKFGFKQIITSAYHPQSWAEICHQTLQTMRDLLCPMVRWLGHCQAFPFVWYLGFS